MNEDTVVVIAIPIALIGVPVLLVLAYRGWVRRTRPSLPHWRNGLGLTALVLLAVCWVWYVLGIFDLGISSMPLFLDLSALAVICTLLSPLLALAWQGVPRLLAVGASLLMLVGYQFFGWTKVGIRLGS
jgi:hypothetical protein